MAPFPRPARSPSRWFVPIAPPGPLARLHLGVLAVAAPVLLTFVALALASCSTPKTTTAVIPGTSSTGTAAVVTHVVDGDTVDLRFGDGRTERVRLLGIDTPETVKPNTPVECFGPEASARTKEVLAAGTGVLIQRDAEARDRYGRLLAYVWRRQDGLFVNRDLVAGGYARTLAIAPNNAHRADLSAAASEASAAGAGLWGACEASADGQKEQPPP